MSLDKEKRHQIIKCFRKYCKDEKWGKVNATRALAAHLYPESSSSDHSKKRSIFFDTWADRIEDVLYKKSTILSNFKDAELADYIYSFLLDNVGNELIGINENLFEKHLANAFGEITASSYKFCANKDLINRIFKIKHPLGSSMAILENYGENVFKCTVVYPNRANYKIRGMNREHHESVRKHPIRFPDEDINVVVLSGLLFSNHDEFISLDGLLIDALKRTVFGAKISNGEHTVPSRTINAKEIKNSGAAVFIRIETSVPYFPKTHTRLACDQVILAGDLVPYNVVSHDGGAFESSFIENKLINELKNISEL